LAERVKTAARVHAGLLPPEASVSRVSLPELLDEWGRHLRDSGCTAKHSRDRPLMVSRVVEAAGAVRPADLTPAKVVRAARVVREALDLSPLTAGYHLSACKQFTRWLAVTRRSETVDHLSGLRCELDQTAPTFTRRALAPAEFDTFVTATRKSKAVIRGLTGRERAALYLTAASTGLRASELAALTPAQFDLGASTVTARAAYAKGRRLDVLPLHPDVAAELKPILKAREPGAAVWPNRERSKWAAWWLEAAEMVAGDLTAAGLAVRDAAGAVFDFHGLRGQLATDLDRAGASLATAQKLMRHSTPKLTSGYYMKQDMADLAGAVGRLKRGKK
jgi:integrase